jgi:hypothetical protein
MSIIVSEKRFAPGHQYRHQLVEAIIDNQFPIDIYGRGAKSYKKKNEKLFNIKGEFQDEYPYKNYLFSICIENFSNHHYFSEKIMSSIMYNCVPIYWGCTNISSYFEEPLLLTGNVTKDIHLLQEILKNPSFYYRETYYEKNKKTINLIENMDRLYNK